MELNLGFLMTSSFTWPQSTYVGVEIGCNYTVMDPKKALVALLSVPGQILYFKIATH